MAEINSKRRGELLHAAFEVLRSEPGGLPAREVIARVTRGTPLTSYESGYYESGACRAQRIDKIIRFLTIPAVKAGWLTKDRGNWHLTSEGAHADLKIRDPEALDRRAQELYREWRRSQAVEDADELTAVAAPESAPAIALEEAEETAWQTVLQFVQSMNPYDLQRLVAALLKAMGYSISWIAPPGPDGGVDILAHTDPLGAREPRIKVQVKRQQPPVGVEGLRSFMAVLSANDLGIFVCTGGFTKDAEDESRRQENRKVTLINAERLFDLWIEHNSKLGESDRRLLPLRPVYYLSTEP